MCVCIILQWSPIFLAPGTCFNTDNFSMDRGGEGAGDIVSHGSNRSGR